MALKLADVVDLDCLISARPIVLGLPSTERYVRGARAIAQRVLATWVREVGLLDLEGKSPDDAEAVILRGALEGLAEDEDHVLGADVAITAPDGDLSITCKLRFQDGSYTFSVSTADAAGLNFEAA